MASFTNFATLSYSGGSATSNTVVGELLETLAITKVAVTGTYAAGDRVTYVISLVNTGTADLTNLTVSDNLGGYTYGTGTVYPLAYTTGSVLYYVNGAIQASPAVTAGPPMQITGITVPAGGNATLIYETTVTDYASPAADGEITNAATVTGAGLTNPVATSELISAESGAKLSVSKSLSPSTVTENGQITYTFVIENTGNGAAQLTDDVILTDTFNPILSGIAVTYNGTAWTAGTNYTYNQTTGQFATALGQITVPAAAFTQNTDGTWTVTPGVSTVVVTGTV